MYKINIRVIPLVLGVYIGIALIMSLDVWIRISLIDTNDLSSYPNMYPTVSIYLIPIVGTFVTVVVFIIELIRSFIWKTQMSHFLHWVILGISYTVFLIFMPLGRLIPTEFANTITILIILIINPVTIHILFRNKYNKIITS